MHLVDLNLVDGTYELVPTCEERIQEGELNHVGVEQDPNEASEEPAAILANPGKPRSMTYVLTCNCTSMQ
jgi:hypothetical protein